MESSQFGPLYVQALGGVHQDFKQSEMEFPKPLIKGRLLRRYKRFLADVELDGGEMVTAHTPNSGSMLGLTAPGNPVFLSFHDNPKRKLKYSWEIVQVGKVQVGINTHLANRLVEEGIQEGTIQELAGYEELARERPYGKNSRVDFLLHSKGKAPCYVEVKNVTLVEGNRALFPDAVTERGRKHLGELAKVASQGMRAVLCYVLQRSDGESVSSAQAIDPQYTEALNQARKQGLEVIAYRARVRPQGIRLFQKVKVS